jgi:hypothetical protein
MNPGAVTPISMAPNTDQKLAAPFFQQAIDNSGCLSCPSWQFSSRDYELVREVYLTEAS